MKKYALQMKPKEWKNTWITFDEFDTIEEAKEAYDSLPIKAGYRIAEAYIVIRYKEIKKDRQADCRRSFFDRNLTGFFVSNYVKRRKFVLFATQENPTKTGKKKPGNPWRSRDSGISFCGDPSGIRTPDTLLKRQDKTIDII